MGPGGSTLKKLQEKHNVKLHVCGRGSSKDKSKASEKIFFLIFDQRAVNVITTII